MKSIPSGIAQRNSVDHTGEPTLPLSVKHVRHAFGGRDEGKFQGRFFK